MNKTDFNVYDFLDSDDRAAAAEVNAQSLTNTLNDLRAYDDLRAGAAPAAVADFACRICLHEIHRLFYRDGSRRAAGLDRVAAADLQELDRAAREKVELAAQMAEVEQRSRAAAAAEVNADSAVKYSQKIGKIFGAEFSAADLRADLAPLMDDFTNNEMLPLTKAAAERARRRADDLRKKPREEVVASRAGRLVSGSVWDALTRAERDIREEREYYHRMFKGYIHPAAEGASLRAGADMVAAVICALYDDITNATITSLCDIAGKELCKVTPQVKSYDSLDLAGADYKLLDIVFTGASIPTDRDAVKAIMLAAARAGRRAAVAQRSRRLMLWARAATDRMDIVAAAAEDARRAAAEEGARPAALAYMSISSVDREALYHIVSKYDYSDWVKKYPQEPHRAECAKRAARALVKAIHRAERDGAQIGRLTAAAAERKMLKM